MYYCPVCGREYMRFSDLKRHFELRYSWFFFNGGVCPLCGTRYRDSGLYGSISFLKHLAHWANDGDPYHAILYALLKKGRYGAKYWRANQLKDIGASLLSDPKYYKCFSSLVRRREER